MADMSTPDTQRSDRYARMHDHLSSELGLRLRIAREEAGLSQHQLGESLGYAAPTVSAFEHGRRRMKIEDLARVCVVLGKEPDYFLRTRELSANKKVVVAATLRGELAALPQDSLREFTLRFLDELEGAEPWVSRVPRLGHFQPEAAARELLDLADIAGPPVQVVDDVCEALGVEVFYRELPEALSAMLLVLDEQQLAVLVNEDHSPVRRRFSVSHELGHAVLTHPAGYHIDYEADAGDPPGYNWMDERQANGFAAALLMDERWIRRDVGNGIVTVSELARRYDVSEAAMSFRLTNLSLLG
jgi:Zn-dependent peptidase ImmA (M78 family)/DNA-binding XRE family transcriptional regulator